MGNAGNAPFYDLDQCLDEGNLSGAWFAAVESRYVYLDQALKLTMLMGLDEVPSKNYEPAVRRFLIRFIREIRPTPEQIRKVANALEELPRKEAFFDSEDARPALESLARQLRERRP